MSAGFSAGIPLGTRAASGGAGRADGGTPPPRPAADRNPAARAQLRSLHLTLSPAEVAAVAKAVGDAGASQGERPDLGTVGNYIRDQVNAPLEKDLFQHYWLGSGTPFALSDSQFGTVTDYIATRDPVGDPSAHTLGGETLVRRPFNFYGNRDLDQAFGEASVFFDAANKPVGFYDNYNFNFRWSDALSNPGRFRAIGGVLGACAVAGNCKPFDVTYGRYIKPE